MYFDKEFEKTVSVLMMTSFILIYQRLSASSYLADLDDGVSLDETFIILVVRVLAGRECDGGEVRGGAGLEHQHISASHSPLGSLTFLNLCCLSWSLFLKD